MTEKEYCPRLIEVALPIREVSAEAVRDKSLRQGHISTLHVWWARRPLAAARAVVFASLVPDPDAPSCPAEFRAAVERHLKKRVPAELKYYMRGRQSHRDEDPYRPYDGMEDTLRNRLLAFIAKWSPEALAFETGKSAKKPKPEHLLDDRSLVKWETTDPDNAQGRMVLRTAQDLVHAAYGGRAPRVLDPFAGGGAIPLEIGRLGAEPIANDYNPVAYLILRATCEYPQRYGRPGRRKVETQEFGKTVEREVQVPNVLAHDVERWGHWVLDCARQRIGHLYPPGKDGLPVMGYLWARTAPCSNPACRSEMPLLRSLVVCDLRSGLRKAALTIRVDPASRSTQFGIVRGKDIAVTEGTMLKKGDVRCPFCKQVTPVEDLRAVGRTGRMGEQMVAVIVEGKNGKDYRAVEESDLSAFRAAAAIEVERPGELILPEINGPDAPADVSHYRSINVDLYGMKTWGSLFNPRQLVAMQTFVGCLREALGALAREVPDVDYRRALGVYLGCLLDRVAQRGSNVGVWHTGQETFEHPFGRQAVPMTWDYPEANPFSDLVQKSVGSDLVTKVVRHESQSGLPATVFLGDASTVPVVDGGVDAVITDPPYFDAIAYSDLSDFFYVWLKRALGSELPEILSTPLTPKPDEATSLKHRHAGDSERADAHFVSKLEAALREARRVSARDGIVTVMFAHQSTKAWKALVQAIFGAGMTIDATWPIDTEKTYALKMGQSVLSSSVTVVCRRRVAGSAAAFKDVRGEVERSVAESVKRFWSYGFRGADLIVACYGPAVGVFGRYERVERADGTAVEVPELLDLARRAALDAIAGEFRSDPVSMLYFVWANVYGTAEQAWDDARLVLQIGGATEDAMEVARQEGIFVVDGATCRLALLADRSSRRGFGADPGAPLVDMLHRAMGLWKAEERAALVAYLGEHDLLTDSRFWKLAQALFEVLPRDAEDWKLVAALLGERDTLRTEARAAGARAAEPTLFDTRG